MPGIIRTTNLRLYLAALKGHTGVPGNEGVDILAGRAAEKRAWSTEMSLAFLKLQVSEQHNTANAHWMVDPSNQGIEGIPPSPFLRKTAWIVPRTR